MNTSTTTTLVDIFREANKKLKYPRIKYPHANGFIIFSLAEKHYIPSFPNLLYIKFQPNQNSYAEYCGKITKTNLLFLDRNISLGLSIFKDYPLLKSAIETIHKNPIESCTLLGQACSYCCFCGTEITSKDSLAVGYGPICADNWGLPWGEREDADSPLNKQERKENL